MKNLYFLLLGLILFSSCKKKEPIRGTTMGTTYSIIIAGDQGTITKENFDSLFLNLNLIFSTYIDSSLISRFNQSKRGIIADWRLKKVTQEALKIARETKGAFDPTVMPLVNGWGFGFENSSSLDSSTVDSLLAFVDYRYILIKGDSLIKLKPGVQLDLSAIAKGFAVDEAGKLLEKKGIHNYMVEIGGEIRTSGKKANGEKWFIGIEKPDENVAPGTTYQGLVALSDNSMATSGNYRNYYYREGKRFSHTISPQTGYPVEHNLLSISVIAGNCMIADGYATAFMVMGPEKTTEFLNSKKELEGYLISSGSGEEYLIRKTTGFNKFLVKKED